ncbi:hypothetical protein TNCV_2702591 [Trichonephila clavipes]|nr:hypothetical protein TNCV_2702591 [Trichonephila clavipes]
MIKYWVANIETLRSTVLRTSVKRKLWMVVNKCCRSIVLLKEESNKTVFLLEEPGNRKKGGQTDGRSSKGLYYRRDTQRQYNTKLVSSNPFATSMYIEVNVRIVERSIK